MMVVKKKSKIQKKCVTKRKLKFVGHKSYQGATQLENKINLL